MGLVELLSNKTIFLEFIQYGRTKKDINKVQTNITAANLHGFEGETCNNRIVACADGHLHAVLLGVVKHDFTKELARSKSHLHIVC